MFIVFRISVFIFAFVSLDPFTSSFDPDLTQTEPHTHMLDPQVSQQLTD